MNIISKHPWILSISGISFATVMFAGCASIPPPTEQIALAKMAASNASDAGANQLAPAEMQTAENKLDQAIQAMAIEEYEKARQLAEQAEVDAQLAAIKARSTKAQEAAITVQEDIRVLRREIDRKSQ